MIYLIIFYLLGLNMILYEKNDLPVYKNPNASIESRVEDLLAKMTIEEKIAQTIHVWFMIGVEGSFSPDSAKKYAMHGLGGLHRRYLNQNYQQAAEESNAVQKHFIEETRLGIPVLLSTEGLHGLMARNATIYPQAIGLGSSWDEELFHRIYTTVALETRALGIHQLFSPNLDIIRDPRWGRTDENFGEDPCLTARLGVAFIKASQGEGDVIDHNHVAATAKHFAVHGQPESGINQAPGNISEREIRNAFLRPFAAAIKEAKVSVIMPSYNEIDGIPAHKNKWLLYDILRNEFNFSGVVISDYYGIEQLHTKHFVTHNREESARTALSLGIDFNLAEPPDHVYPTLVQQIKAGKVPEQRVDNAVRRILRLKFRLGLFDNPYVNASHAAKRINTADHKALALEAAHKSIVLLKNENKVLPLDKTKLKTIAVIGPNANVVQLGTYTGTNNQATTVLDGLINELGNDKVKFAQGCRLTKKAKPGSIRDFELWDRQENLELIKEAAAVAASCDLTILAIGSNTTLCREAGGGNTSGDRSSLDLVGEQNELAAAVLHTGKPVVVLLFNGRPLSFNYIAEQAPAILECWYPGEATGTAVADILFGKVNPSAKLPITFPASVGHIPSYYNRKSSAPLKYAVNTKEWLYPFGYGLSYTHFSYSNLSVTPSVIEQTGTAVVTVDVKNKGEVAGDEIVQLYIRDVVSSATRPVKELKDFKRVHLQPGERKAVQFEITPDKLAFYNEEMKNMVEPGQFVVMVGTNSVTLDTVMLEVK
jgi:beta-glucosidase